ncbi:MAG: hypothetical protein EHM78_23680 [Myxococcaceae bacterium]|nr:MAG: hypothetical protein EHM78_23680 [Myxococcaceae bacterium]
MGLQETLSQVLKSVTAGNASDVDVDSAYDRVAGEIPSGDLSEGIAHVFNSDQTPAFEQMLGGLFNQSSPDQKAGLLTQILGALGPNAAQVLGGTAGLGGLAALLQEGGTVSPQQAQEVSPETVQVLAQKASQTNPSIVDKAAQFYAEHPALVKGIGAGALALLMSHLSGRTKH